MPKRKKVYRWGPRFTRDGLPCKKPNLAPKAPDPASLPLPDGAASAQPPSTSAVALRAQWPSSREKALKIASLVYGGEVSDPTNGARHFVNKKKLTSWPKWLKMYRQTVVIGQQKLRHFVRAVREAFVPQNPANRVFLDLPHALS